MSPSSQQTTDLLRDHGLRSTPARAAVVGHLLAAKAAAPLVDLVAVADADRITLYRTLKTLEEQGLVHRINDANGNGLYALCQGDCSPAAHVHAHPHFQCDDCGNPFCLPEVAAPEVVLPKGYRLQEVHVTYQGSCADCVTQANA